MKKLFLLFALCVICSGCVSTKKLDYAIMQQMNGKTICPVVMPAKNPIDIYTSGEASGMAIGGIIGMAVAATSDDLNNGCIDEHYGVRDPSIDLAKELATTLAKKHNMTSLSAKRVLSRKSTAEEIAHAISSDYILCSQTVGWGFSYYSMSWNRYRPSVRVHVQLLNGKTGKLLAEKTTGCVSDLKAEHAPTYEQLFYNNAQAMKSSLTPFPDLLAKKIYPKIFEEPRP